MSKAIYSLKIYLFRDSFGLTTKEKKGIFEVCQFIVFIYIKAWYTAALAVKSPNNDLKLIKQLSDYETDIAKVALHKLQNHLWYLTPEASAMSFFDKKISREIKNKMVKALYTDSEGNIEAPKNFLSIIELKSRH